VNRRAVQSSSSDAQKWATRRAKCCGGSAFLLAVCRRLGVELRWTRSPRRSRNRRSRGEGRELDRWTITASSTGARSRTKRVSWAEQAQLVHWRGRRQSARHAGPPFARWFVAGNQPLLQRARPAPRCARRPEGAPLYLHGDGRREELQLPRAPPRSAARGAMMRSLESQRRRSSSNMPMIPEAVFVISRLRQDRRDPLGGVRRIRRREPPRRIDDAHRSSWSPPTAGSRMEAGVVQGARRRGAGPSRSIRRRRSCCTTRFRSGGCA